MNSDPLLTWKGRRVRSPGEGPMDAAKKVPSAILRPGSLFFIPSPLEGWGVDRLLDQLPADSVIVLQELDLELRNRCDPALRDFLGERINDPRLYWLHEDSEQAIRELFQRVPISRLRRCEFLTFNGAWISSRARYRQIFERIDSGLVQFWSNRITCIHLGPLWIRNIIDNLSEAETLQSPWPDWGSSPILICGAGVTLEGALLWARENRRKIKVLAVDTALPVLKDWDITPDAVVCLESQHANLRDFIDWTKQPIDLFADLTAYPPSTRVLSGNTHWYISRFSEINLWDRWPWKSVPVVPPMGSVGVAAVWIASRLTSGAQVLAGLDFSYPPGKTHSRGAPSIRTLATKTNRFLPMEQTRTWNGYGKRLNLQNGWLTTPVMESYASVLTAVLANQVPEARVWSNCGLPLGIPTWQSSDFNDLPVKETPASYPVQSQSPQDWLCEEAKLWRRILVSYERLNADPEDLQVLSELMAQLKAVDYLTFSFADPNQRETSDWLSRAKVQVLWALSRVEQLLD